jgi:GT2 family glycosyltransferase
VGGTAHGSATARRKHVGCPGSAIGMTPPLDLVSVVVVNFRGAEDTITCVRSLRQMDWPPDQLEIVVVDNASGDDSVSRIRAADRDVIVVESAVNTGFAGGCNLGAQHASGRYIGFINNDARADQRWVGAAVDVLRQDDGVACVASKVLDWEGQHIDFVDGSLTWYGMGYKREVGLPDLGGWEQPKDVLFATGAGMLIQADVFRDAGGFDERFFMFYEDVDLGWRLNVLGYRIRYVPSSVAYHRHHSAMGRFGEWRERFLLERNALMCMIKNYDDQRLTRILPAALALAVRRGVTRGGDDPGVLDLARGSGDEEEHRLQVSKETLVPVYAIDSLVDLLPDLMQDRARIAERRRRSDIELLPLFGQLMEPAYPEPRYLDGYRKLVEAFKVREAFSTRHRIVIVTGEPITARMAGPAIRAWEMANVLSREHDVKLVSLKACSVHHPEFESVFATDRDLLDLEDWCEVFIFQGLVMAAHPWLRESDKVIVADVYNPFHLEQLEQAKDRGELAHRRAVRDCVQALNDQLERGDFFMCASLKQRDFWLGQLAALNRVNPSTYNYDETLNSLIAVVPFGLPDTAPVHGHPAIKGIVPGIGADDKVVLWGGGIYNWFDPLTLIRAVDRLRHSVPTVRLFFLGMRHPNPDVPAM